MRLRKLTLKNINALKDTLTINFLASPLVDTGLFAIIGDTGAGKSSILDAITLALYGKIHRNNNVKEVMTYGATESLAEVEFETKGKLYRSKWMLWRANKKIDGNFQTPRRELAIWREKKKAFEIVETAVRMVDKQIEEVTGLDFQRFCRSVMLSQGDFAAFLKANEKERSELLERITGTEIYSNISQATHKRKRIEEQELEFLNSKIQSLQLLSEDAIKELQEERQKYMEESAVKQKQKETIGQQIQIIQQLKTLKQQIVTLDIELQNYQSEQLAAQPQYEQLRLHRQVEKILPQLAHLQEAVQQQQKLESDLQNNKGQLSTTRITLERYQQQYEQCQNHFNVLKTTEKEAVRLFEEITELDIQINHKQMIYNKDYQDFQKIEAAQTSIEAKIVQKQAQIKQDKQQLDNTETWLVQNAYLVSLQEESSWIKEIYMQFSQKALKLQEIDKKLISAESSLKSIDKEYKALQQQKNSLSDQLNELKSKIHIVDEAVNGGEVTPVLESTNEILHQKRLEKIEIERQLREVKEAQQILENVAAIEEKIAEIDKEQLTLFTLFRDIEDEITAEKKNYENYYKIYDQQRTIANYNADRIKLKEGEACPLCFSKEHPFRELEIVSYLDETEEMVEKTKMILDRLEVKKKTLFSEEAKLFNERNQLEQRKIAYQNKLELDDSSNHITYFHTQSKKYALQKQKLEQELKDTETTISLSLQKMEQLKELNKHYQEIQLNSQRIDNDIHKLDHKKTVQGEQCNYYKQQSNDQRKEYEKYQEQLMTILNKYQLNLDKDTKTILHQLDVKQKQYKQQSDLAIHLKNQQKIYENDLATATETKERIESELDTQTRQLEKSKSEVDVLQAHRQSKFGKKSVEIEKQALQQRLERSEQNTMQAKTDLDQAQITYKLLQNTITEQENRLSEENAKVAKLQTKAQQTIESMGFQTIAVARAAVLPITQVEAIEQLKTQLNQSIAKTQTLLENSKQQLKLEQAKVVHQDRTEKELVETLEKLKQLEKELHEKIGEITGRLKQDKQASQESKTLKQQLFKQQKEYNRWVILHELIGSNDGKKFQIFAQRLTLEKLVQLANIHLIKLNGRYSIKCNEEQLLELDIIDAYQADNIRSMNTLSGGESFLVSLALALGLSDLAGRDMDIRSLFIDEGFGTLDESTLDMALTTLENLQATGKTIGIISHVKALKERISTQIKVEKSGNGFSTIKMVG